VAVRHAWADALAAPTYDGPPLWLHGDLHPALALGVVFLAHSADNPQIHGIGRRTVAAILDG
jgi:hypothetical protein